MSISIYRSIGHLARNELLGVVIVACGVMVIVIGNGHRDQSSNPIVLLSAILLSRLGSCRIHRLHLYRGVTPQKYDTIQSDGEVPVKLELWGMRSTLSLSSLTDPLWPGVVALVRVLSMGQIELNCILTLN